MNDPVGRLSDVIVDPKTSIREALIHLDKAGTGALLLCKNDRKLVGFITDGDIRRAILQNMSLEAPCDSICTKDPVVTTQIQDTEESLQLMNRLDINHLPVVDGDQRVLALLLRSDLSQASPAPLSAVIMAGGYGRRMHPLTENTPKPMLRVGDQPLLERTIQGLREAGIRQVNITTHHMARVITEHFGDGADFGVQLSYVNESHPLGTAGGLKLMVGIAEPVLVINGDILTGVRFRNIVDYHKEVRADVTIGVRQYEQQVPYGVIESDGPYVRSVREKPTVSYLVNAGIYVLEPTVYRYIPSDRRFDMTDLIQRLLDAGRPVASFPIVEYWIDIGRPADYERAQQDFSGGRVVV